MNIEAYQAALTTNANAVLRDDDYPHFLTVIRETFQKHIGSVVDEDEKTTYRNLYRSTGVKGGSALFDLFLEGLPEDARQHYNCDACRGFINRYGSLLVVEDDKLIPAMWDVDAVPPFFKNAVANVSAAITKRISIPFFTSRTTAGTPVTGPWSHMSVDIPSVYVTSDVGYVTDHYASNFDAMRDMLAKYHADEVAMVVNLYRAGNLLQGDRYMQIAEMLYEIIQALQSKFPNYHNILQNNKGIPTDLHTAIWEIAMNAPDWFRVKNTVLDTLLEDIHNGMSQDDVIARYNNKTDSINYQRTSKDLSDTAIDTAERLIAQLGLAPSLSRRYASLEEIQCVWKPTSPDCHDTPTDDSLFGYLKSGNNGSHHAQGKTVIDAGPISLQRFLETVAPSAKRMSVHINQYSRFAFGAFVTAADLSAPPIIVWDKEDARNPVSWYMTYGGDQAHNWGLGGYHDVNVTGIAYSSNMWQEGYSYIPTSCMFILENCKHTTVVGNGAGLCLFPEILRPELRPARAVIERYSNTHSLQGEDTATACGIWAGKNDSPAGYPIIIEVTDKFGTRRYMIDRWE